MHCSIALDYIPALRNIAVLEQKANDVFETLKASSSDDENFASFSRRRASRRRGALVRDQYFSELVDEDKVNETCKSYANMRLTLI